MKGTIDRIENKSKAVILIESTDDKEQIVIDKDQLPKDLQYSGCILEFEMKDGDPRNFKHLNSEEKNRRKRIERKFDRLSERLSDSK